jgi:hypothetical protein
MLVTNGGEIVLVRAEMVGGEWAFLGMSKW